VNDKSQKPAFAADLQDVCDYIIWKINEGDARLNVLKLHKLLYYVQAWHLAFGRGRCFDASFQAWVHGPVCRPIYDRFKDNKSMYSPVRSRDISKEFDPDELPKKVRRHIDRVLEGYAEFTDDQLEEMTHRERPWIEAREGYDAKERCENAISDSTMASYYGARLKRNAKA
jgi:uncharacterized phage-associated protein